MRAMTSLALPGVSGTITWIGFVGQLGAEPCDQAWVWAIRAILGIAMAAARSRRRLMGVTACFLPLVLPGLAGKTAIERRWQSAYFCRARCVCGVFQA